MSHSSTPNKDLQIIKYAQEEDRIELNFFAYGLNTIPEEVRDMKNLRSLDLTSNSLKSLPDWLGELTNLQHLNLVENSLESLPASLGNLTNLQSLSVNFNNISSLPECLVEMTNLRSLSVAHNFIENLPEWLGELTNLRSLDLSSNPLKSLPDSLGEMTNLRSLDLSGNSLESVPGWLGNLTNLQSLNVTGSVRESLQDRIGELTNLQSLKLSFNSLKSLPGWLGNLTNLRSLDLTDNSLEKLPDSLGKLTNLRSLDLSSNSLESLPGWLGNLTTLQSLDVSFNHISSLPAWLGELTNLKSLDVAGNSIEKLPDSLGNLTNLQSLRVAHNSLESLPDSLGKLTDLRLDLSSNSLESLPDSIGNLTNLRSLDLTDNSLESLPGWLGNLTNLKSLDLSSNSLVSLPDSLGNLTNLQSLRVAHNSLESLPDSLGKLTDLRSLDLSSNSLVSLPDSLGELTNLQHLNLVDNSLESLPASLGKLTNLHSLSVSQNSLKSLPDNLGAMTNLWSLDLTDNSLESLPDSLGEMTNLWILDLSSNSLESLPDSLGEMTNLWSLNLSSNSLKSLPDSLSELENLETLYVFKNPLRTPPLDLAVKGIDEIKSYFEAAKEGTEPVFEAKMILVGNGRVGKTSIANRLIFGRYNPKENPSHGIKVYPWKLHNVKLPGFDSLQNVKLQVWDFGGQEIYHATHPFFMTNRAIYLCVWDSENENNLSKSENGDFPYEYWLDKTKVLSNNSPVILVQNKIDEGKQRIDNQTVLEDDYNVQEFLHMSAQTNEGVDMLHSEVKKILENHSKVSHMIGMELPLSWWGVRVKLKDLLKNKPELPIQKYHQLCDDNKVKDGHRKYLLNFLNDISDIYLFEDSLIMNPQWIVELIYELLSESVIKNDGEFNSEHVNHILQRYEKDIRERLITILQKFELIFKAPDNKDKFIAPQYLPESKPENFRQLWTSQEKPTIIYRYPKYVHQSHMVRMLSRFGEFAVPPLYWRYGALLIDKDGVRILIEQVSEKKEIRVILEKDTKDNRKSDLLNAIFKSFQEVNWNTGVKKIIPFETKEGKVKELDLNVLMEWLNSGKRTYQESDFEVDIVEVTKGLIKSTEFHKEFDKIQEGDYIHQPNWGYINESLEEINSKLDSSKERDEAMARSINKNQHILSKILDNLDKNMREILVAMNESISEGEVEKDNMEKLIQRLEQRIDENKIEISKSVREALDGEQAVSNLKLKIGLPFLLEYELGISGNKALSEIKAMVPESWGEMLDKYYSYQRNRL